MTSILFSDTPAKGYLHPLPNKTTAISYSYTPDLLTISAHMEDNFAHVEQRDPQTSRYYDSFFQTNCYNCKFENGGRCQSVRDSGFGPSTTVCPRGIEIDQGDEVKFDVAPAIFNIPLQLSPKQRFVPQAHFNRVWLQASMVKDKRIKLSRNRKGLANTWSGSNVICWGRNQEPKNLRGMVRLFFESPFNNDLVSIKEFVENNEIIKKDVETGNFFRTYSRYKFITEKSDALFMLHAEDNVQAFFWMISAGFKPIADASHLMLIPLTETVLEHEGNSYPGYLTEPDSCNKQWFVTKSGDLIGQL